MTSSKQYEPVIGLEVHAQLLTESKAFCGCSTRFGSEPNSNVCPVCLGLPGALPVLNKQVVELTIRMGATVRSTIRPHSVFARKNYFYPDLPKGFQISQYEEPICSGGYVEIELDDGSRKKIGLTRIHMEEDAGKSIHDQDAQTLVDLNRSGVPLIEIVSEPDIRSAHEAYLYLHKVRQIVTYLGICDGNMEEGSLRCDANVSVREKGAAMLGTKTEVKNMNSFRHVERAIEFEVNRQIEMLENGEPVVQETLLWDADRNFAYPMRSKEEAHDYRYFPEPDLVPVRVDSMWINTVSSQLPEHPTARRDRFVANFGLPRYDADILTAEKEYADYFEATVTKLSTQKADEIKVVSNWLMTDVLRIVGERKIGISEFPISPSRLANMIGLILDGTISGKIAKEVFEAMLESGDEPKSIVEKKGLSQISDEATLGKIIEGVMANNRSQVERFQKGEEKIFGHFVGQVMKATGGKANPALVNSILRKKLSEPIAST